MNLIEQYLEDIRTLTKAIPTSTTQRIVSILTDAYNRDNKLILMGNGGSSSTASHLVADFQKLIYLAKYKPFQVLSLTDNVPLITAWSNDTDYSNIFAEQIRTWAGPGDIVMAFSGSGNSPNVLKGISMAVSKGATTVGFSGFDGGKLSKIVGISLVVPCNNMQKIEDMHMMLGHMIFYSMCEGLKYGEGIT